MFTVTRQIGIDAGHRVHTHGSKCKGLHGHRYLVEATCAADELVTDGVQSGMVTDFGFLKEVMVKHIHDTCDHALILARSDPLVEKLLGVVPDKLLVRIVDEEARAFGVIYLLEDPPTAEILARHWFMCMVPDIHLISRGHARLVRVKVWETPNCFAEFTGPPLISAVGQSCLNGSTSTCQ